jgi:hypothetical protein
VSENRYRRDARVGHEGFDTGCWTYRGISSQDLLPTAAISGRGTSSRLWSSLRRSTTGGSRAAAPAAALASPSARRSGPQAQPVSGVETPNGKQTACRAVPVSDASPSAPAFACLRIPDLTSGDAASLQPRWSRLRDGWRACGRPGEDNNAEPFRDFWGGGGCLAAKWSSGTTRSSWPGSRR